MTASKEEIEIKLLEIFQLVFNQTDLKVHDELTASEVKNWDSLSHMIMINEVEKKFDVKFKLKDLNRLKNVGALIDVIHEKISI